MNQSNTFRNAILTNISRALKRQGSLIESDKLSEQQIITAYQQALTSSTPNIETTITSSESVQQRFIEAAIGANAKVEELTSTADIPSWLASLNNKPQQFIYVAEHPLLDDVDWSKQAHFKTTADYKKANQWGVIPTECAIAETGSIVLKSQETHATAAGFLLDVLVVIVRQYQIVERLNDIWPSLNEDEKIQSRAINIITGPSRTADVEQKVQLGAHGPRQLIIGILP